MKKMYSLLLAAVALAAGTMAHASDTGGIAVELKAGTLGGGAEINYAISPMFTVGVGINKYSASTTDTADNIDYDVDLDLQSIALLANYHPFSGTFRLTAGAMLNSNELRMTAKPNGTYDIGGTTYNANDIGTLEATVDFNSFAPYAGIGWGKSASSGFGFTLDVGVLFQGSPNVSLKTKNTDYAAIFIATGKTQAEVEADVKREESNTEDDIKGFTMYPVASLGINYRF
jgi:hypothetical protein